MNQFRAICMTFAAASMTSHLASAQCSTGGLGGSFPQTSGFDPWATWNSVLPNDPLISPLSVTVPAGAAAITSVNLNGLAHPWSGVVHVALESPSGVKYNLLVTANFSSVPFGGCPSNFGGNYTILDPISCEDSFDCGGAFQYASGSYAQSFSSWNNGAAGLNNVRLEQIPIESGTWTLYVYDWMSTNSSGTLASWDMCFGSPTAPSAPPTVAPLHYSPVPNSMACDITTLAWREVPCATAYEVELDGALQSPVTGAGFTTPSLAVGNHTWRVRASNSAGAGPFSSLQGFASTGAPTGTPAPSGPYMGLAWGPYVTLRWEAVACASSYEIEVDGVIYTSSLKRYVYSSTPGFHAWTVRATNAHGVGPWSPLLTFEDFGPPPIACSGPSLPTLFASDNLSNIGAQLFFDVNVTNPAGITVSQLDTNVYGPSGTTFRLDIFIKAGTFSGFEHDQAAWTLAAAAAPGISQGSDQPSLVDCPDFTLGPGVTGFSLVIHHPDRHLFTGAAGSPPPTFFSNADLSITGGAICHGPWTSQVHSPRMWNGAIRYDCGPTTPINYCTAGTSTNGCLATVGADYNPSLSLAHPCTLTVSGVEGQKNGIVFYGLAPLGASWGAGSNSFLCVKSPAQRTGAQGSGGTADQCDGTLSLDWNGYQSANPTSVGNPWSVGNHVYVQAWFRDPPAAKTTNLSNALDMTYLP